MIRLDHERLTRVVDNSADTMVIVTDTDGVITTMNQAAVLFLDQDCSSVIGSWTLEDLAGTALRCGPRAAPGEAQDWTLKQGHRQQRIISVRLSLLHDAQGEFEGYVLVGDDVSEQRQTEQIRREAAQKQAARIASLEARELQRHAFIATASHELRTPVTSILGYTEMLADGDAGDLTAPQHSLIERVNCNSRRLLHLVQDLLNLERGNLTTAVVRTEIEAGKLANRVWESIRAELTGRALDTTLEVASGCSMIHGDPVQLERALLNLLTNAVKFTPDGGSVRLGVRPCETGVLFEVTDTGLGIAKEDQVAIFEPFFRSQAAQVQEVPGSGIGLAVVRRIVESHGGCVALESEVGYGTTVRFAIG